MAQSEMKITFRIYRVNVWALIAYMYVLTMINMVRIIESAEITSHSVKMNNNTRVIYCWVKIKWA